MAATIFMIVCGLLTVLAMIDFLLQKSMPSWGQIKPILAALGGLIFIFGPVVVGALLAAANNTVAPGAVGLLCTWSLAMAVSVRIGKV